MPRIKIELPAVFSFQTSIAIRITDINYGGHVGNDTILSIIHEARLRFLNHKGFSELDIGGIGLIMSDAAIQFKAELFYGETVKASVAATEFSKVGFEVYYLLEKEMEGKSVVVATAKTAMLCYDYAKKKLAPVPDDFRTKLTAPSS